MPKFTYKAKRGLHDIIEGEMDADSVDSVVEKLNFEGYVPFAIEDSSLKYAEVKTTSGKVKTKDINIFTRQMANLLRSKVTLLKALGIVHDQTENFKFKIIINELLESVREGGNLSDELARHPKYFSSLYVNTIRSGEIGSVLEESLERLAGFAEKEEEFNTKIRIAIAYPIFMLITGVGTILVMLTFVMPKLAAMFADMGQTLPLPTLIVINASNFMSVYWPWLLIGFSLIVLLARKRGISKKEKYLFDRFKLSLPVIGKFITEAEASKFARTVALLMDNGVSLYQAVEAANTTLSNEVIKKDLQQVGKGVISGQSFSKSLQSSNAFPPFVISMITVGEEGGTLSNSLNDVADYYEREGDQAMKIISSMLEPAMILAMGLVIGFMVIAMLLPVFDLNVMSSH